MKTYKSTISEIQLKKLPSEFKKVKITKSEDASNYIKQFYSDDIEIFESMFLLLLNQANNTIGYAKISQGGITGTVVDVKIILKYAIDSLASGVILAHNHPSGTLKPSKADLDVTDKVKKALNMVDCRLLDHVIVTKDSFYSFADNGNL